MVTPLPIGFRDVDRVAVGGCIRCLDGIGRLPAGRAYKERSRSLLNLGPGDPVLDVACGLGDDVAALQAEGALAVGVDRSRSLIAAAQARHGSSGSLFAVAEAGALPLASGSFAAVRIDRALQHIDAPARVVQEMARVTRPGGVVLAAEPDWGTFLLAGPAGPVREGIEDHWRRSFRHPWIGRELPQLLADAGLVDRGQEAIWLATEGFADTDLLFEVAATVQHLAPTLPGAGDWLAAYRAGDVRAGVLILISWGRRP